MGLSHEDVQEIIALLDDLDATELHLRTRHFALWLRRDGHDPGWRQATSIRSEPHLLDQEPAVTEAAAATPEPSTDDTTGLVAVRTPMMGTFYRAPKPGDPPFVEVGAPVEAETVIGIVETMKLMTSVHAGVRGRVAEICLANAQAAPQGAVLMRIAPE